MKLVYLLTTADARAGTERTFADQARAQGERGQDVTVLSVYRRAERGFDYGPRTDVRYATDLEGPEGAPSRVIPEEWDDQFCARADCGLLARLRDCDADIVITSTPALTVYALLGLPEHVRIVQEEHRASLARGVTGVPLLRHGPSVDAVVSLTHRNADWLRAQWGEGSPRIDVIPNALPDTGRPVSGRRQKVIMGAGRLVRSKGFLDLVRAFALLAPDFPDWRLRIFGDGPERRPLQRTLRELGLTDRVDLMPPTADIEREWARASIGALASRNEGLPLVLLEARGAHLPLVAYDCETGPREIIEHGTDGYLVPVGDVDALAEAFRPLMADEALRDAMGEAAPASLRRFAPEVVADQWSQLFADLVTRPSARSIPVATAAGGDAPDAEVPVEAVPAAGRPDSVVVPASSLVPGVCRERTREVLEEVFAGSDVRARPLLPHDRGLAWAVPAEHRAEVLQVLTAARVPGLEVRLYAGNLRLDSDGTSWQDGGEEVDLSAVTRLYAFRRYASEDGRHRLGYYAGLSVDLWSEDPSRPGVWRGRIRNREYDALRRDQFDRGLFAPWSPLGGRPLWSSVEFPVDVVYTWVDGADPAWRARRAAHDPSAGPSARVDLAGGELRYLNRDELRYSLRSVHSFAPWVRTIHLVTDGQRPAWLPEGTDRVRVVDHRDLFPDPSDLPVFNSHAIETVLHRIPGLSEHFLYFNDDVLLLREQGPEAYFTGSGQPRMFPSPTQVNDLGDLSEPHEAAGLRNRELVAGTAGVTLTQGMLHTPYAHRVSHLRHLTEERFPEDAQRTRRARFRSPTDISLVSSLAQYCGYAEGGYVTGSLRVGYVSLGSPDTAGKLARAAAGSLDVLSLGEFGEDPDPRRTQKVTAAFLESTFPVPAPWETDASPAS